MFRDTAATTKSCSNSEFYQQQQTTTGQNAGSRYRRPAIKNKTRKHPTAMIDADMNILKYLSEKLKHELVSSHGSSDSISSILCELESSLPGRKLDWSNVVEELIESLKSCLIIRESFGKQLDRESAFSKKSAKVFLGTQEIKLDVIVKLAFNTLASIIQVLPPNDGLKFFECLMGNVQHSKSQTFLSLFCDYQKREAYSQSVINTNDLIGLIISSIRRGKCMLTYTEPKAVAYHHIPHTSIAASAGRLLDGLCEFLIDSIDVPIVGLDLIKAQDALVTAVGTFPLAMMNDNIFQKLVLFVYNTGENVRSVVSQEVILQLMTLIVTAEWDDENMILGLSRTEFQQFVISYCGNIVTEWVYSVDTNSLGNVLKETGVAENALAVLISFAKNRFNDFMPMSIRSLRMVHNVVSMARAFEKQSYEFYKDKGGNQDNNFENSTSSQSIISKGYVLVKTITQGIGKHLQDGEYMEEFNTAWYELMVRAPEFVNLATCIDITSALVDCFSAVNEIFFEQLSASRRVFCVVSVLGYSRDNDDRLRAKGARCLSLFLEFRRLNEGDEDFILNCLDAIDSGTRTGDVYSRSAFAWAAGNLCDVMAKHHRDTASVNLGLGVFAKIYEMSVHIVEDNPRMTYNANRALGGLVSWTPTHLLSDPHNLQTFLVSIASFLKGQMGNGADFKARWNACHALGNFTRYSVLWKQFYKSLACIVFPAFMCVLQQSDNFKERSNSIKGIVAVQERAQFADYFKDIWVVMLEALNTIPDTKIPISHGQVERFREEVALGVLHMAYFIMPSDLEASAGFEAIFLGNLEALIDTSEMFLGGGKEQELTDEMIKSLSIVKKIVEDLLSRFPSLENDKYLERVHVFENIPSL